MGVDEERVFDAEAQGGKFFWVRSQNDGVSGAELLLRAGQFLAAPPPASQPPSPPVFDQHTILHDSREYTVLSRPS